jgi:hypothetical protein
VEAVAVLPDQAQARDLAQRVGEDALHVAQHVEPDAKCVGRHLARQPEQLRVALADVCTRVGLAEPVGEGGVEGRERQARPLTELEPDREQRLGRPAHGRVLEVDRSPPCPAGIFALQEPQQVADERRLPLAADAVEDQRAVRVRGRRRIEGAQELRGRLLAVGEDLVGGEAALVAGDKRAWLRAAPEAASWSAAGRRGRGRLGQSP